MKAIDSKQPDWVCHDCGQEWGRWYEDNTYFGPAKHCATYHVDECGVCGEQKSVTEARDYGFLKRGWRKKVLN